MIKKTAASLFIAISLLIPSAGYTQNMYEKVPFCMLWLIGIAATIDQFIKDINNSRTTGVNINGVKGVFQTNTLVENPALKGAILKGELVKPLETSIHGRGIFIEPGTVDFHKNGTLARCSIRPSDLLAGGNSTVPCRMYAEFHDDGFLKGTCLDDDSAGSFILQGKSCRIKGDVRFYRDGLVSECTLVDAIDAGISNYITKLPADTVLHLNGKHEIIYIHPPYKKTAAVTFKGESLDLAGDIYLYDNGNIRNCMLTFSISIQNGAHKVKAGKNLTLYDNEMIESCMLIHPVILEINGSTIEFDKSRDSFMGETGSSLEFYKNGKVKCGETTRNRKQFYVHRGKRIYIKDGYWMSFYESGKIKELYPVRMTSLKVGRQELLLAQERLSFYENGDILSAGIKEGSSFVYQGMRIKTGLYSTQLFFDDKQDVMAFINDSDRIVLNNGKNFKLPRFYAAGYSDYDKGEISFVCINHGNIAVPGNVNLFPDEKNKKNKWTEVFIKADQFYNDKNGEIVLAQGVSEIMFTEDAVIIIDGAECRCRAMEWVKLPQGQ